MYHCERCKGTFARFKTPGQCPLCGMWASVRCNACGYTDDARQFIQNSDLCPNCGAKVALTGGGTPWLTKLGIGGGGLGPVRNHRICVESHGV